MMDLKEMYGGRFRIITDPAAGPRNKDPWMWMIPCGRWRGEIYPHSLDRRILAFLGRTRYVPSALQELQSVGCSIQCEGDDEFIVTFPLERAEAVFEVVQPRRRVRLSDEERERRAENLKKHRLNPIKKGWNRPNLRLEPK